LATLRTGTVVIFLGGRNGGQLPARLRLALAGASASRPPNLAALALPPVASWLAAWRMRVFAHALIANAGEEQDLCAAITGRHWAAAVRWPETDDVIQCDVIQCGPLRESVDRCDSISMSKSKG
jgi:hypothetical protein